MYLSYLHFVLQSMLWREGLFNNNQQINKPNKKSNNNNNNNNNCNSRSNNNNNSCKYFICLIQCLVLLRIIAHACPVNSIIILVKEVWS